MHSDTESNTTSVASEMIRKSETCYFVFATAQNGSYQPIGFHEKRPDTTALSALAKELGERVILMEGRIIEEINPPGGVS